MSIKWCSKDIDKGVRLNLVLQYVLHWRHNGHASVSNHQLHDCLLNRLFRHWSKKISKPRVAGLCAGNSPGTGEFPAQIASNAENVSIWWRHHGWELCTATVFRMHIRILHAEVRDIKSLTHWCRGKMAAIFQTTFSYEFSWMKIFESWLKSHWSLFLRFQLTLFQHWLR